MPLQIAMWVLMSAGSVGLDVRVYYLYFSLYYLDRDDEIYVKV